ncbi:MAG: uroporphyrinogen decarboxylase [Flavobacteriia bacterium]|nr:uroporphyrinogen decarboxylase [Flavobacteriia bacterium]
MNAAVFEWIGYSASIFIVLSFVINQLRIIRIINMLGCICFVIYGIYFKAWPVVIPNAMVVFIQLYYLLHKDKQNANG